VFKVLKNVKIVKGARAFLPQELCPYKKA